MIPIVNNTIRVKQVNVELVKTALKALESGTKITLANATGLSVATCSNILNELLERGEVIKADLEQSSGGRPAQRFMYNANYAYAACLFVSNDEGRYYINYAIVNMLGEIVEQQTDEVSVLDYEAVDQLVEKLIDRYENITALGIGVPGLVNKGFIGSCDIEELSDVALADRLKEKYNVAVTVENDVNLIAYGFYQEQKYDEDKSIAVVIFPRDNCSGAGLMVDGHIVRGNTNFAGEISYLPFDISRAEQIRQLNLTEGVSPIMVKTLVSIIAVINPATIVITGNLVRLDMLGQFYHACKAFIPCEHLPQLRIKENMRGDYMKGLISITLESLACNVQLIEKRL
ncbi:ROK family protein [Anaerosinus massiliensis]|uniref:ROK family protein n=1 Tax=Massilibacillus massiliensis TaxID=1806837 RepID=UPI000A7086B2|nr:ROK family protein [Massilibacillus massiliensis]